MKHNINKLFFLSALFLLLPGCVNNKTNTDNKESKVDSGVIEHEHTFSDIWSYDEDYHWHASTCGHTDVVKDKAEHSYGDMIIDVEPTENEEGRGHRICTICHYSHSVTILKVDHIHNYNDPTYVWTEDNSHCTATRVCQKDETHIDTETVESSLDIVSEVTDSVDGLYRYTATFTNKAFETQIKDIVVPATGKVSYVLNDDEQGYTAKASNSDIEGTISIPATHNGLPVTDVGDFKNTKITSVVIADGVAKIDNSAFYQCKQLETVTMPDSIIEIGSSAFYYCSALKDPILSKSLKILGSNSFVACGKIENFVIPSSIEEIRGQFLTSNNNAKLSIVVEDVEDFLAIDGKNNIVNDIHLIAKDGKEIEELIIPNGVDELASYSLYRLPFIKKVILPEGLTTIGIRAFKYMRSLCNITIPSTVTSIGNDAFVDCDRLLEVVNKSSLSITKGSTSNGKVAYYAVHVVSDEANATFNVDANGFVTVSNDTQVWLARYDGNEVNVVLPNNITHIAPYCFVTHFNMETVEFNSSLITISKQAFRMCTGLKSVNIPTTLKKIETGAFEGASSIETMTLPFIGESASNQKPLGSIFGWTTSHLNGPGTFVPASLKEIVLLDTITVIPEKAFQGASHITSINIPNTVIEIKNYAFMNTGVSEYVIPDSVTTIGLYAFGNNSNLTKVTIGNGVLTIGEGCFAGCESLEIINFNGTMDRWGVIELGKDWNAAVATKVVHCTDGDVEITIEE